MNIHTFGDSHAGCGWNNILKTSKLGSILNIHHIGAPLCYSFGKRGFEILNIKDYNKIVKNDIVIFSFGEIDCRCHIHKHISSTATYQMIIDEIVDNYLKAIQQNIAQFSKIYTCVYNIVPPIQKGRVQEYPAYPFLGTDEERKQYILYFNEQLKKKCPEYNFIFFDIYDKYTDSKGFLDKLKSDGAVHIRDPIYLEEFLEKILIDIKT